MVAQEYYSGNNYIPAQRTTSFFASYRGIASKHFLYTVALTLASNIHAAFISCSDTGFFTILVNGFCPWRSNFFSLYNRSGHK